MNRELGSAFFTKALIGFASFVPPNLAPPLSFSSQTYHYISSLISDDMDYL